jgi:hypothetical protein
MNACRSIWVSTLGLLIIVAGCGTGFDPNNVNVTVSPATAAVSENGQTTLQANVNDLCSTCSPEIGWSVTENNGLLCSWVDTQPSGPCPGGTIQVLAFGNSPTATYIAPNTTGVFHVVAEDVVTFTIMKEGTSVVTVTP